jgi:hypothetical protein
VQDLIVVNSLAPYNFSENIFHFSKAARRQQELGENQQKTL